MIILKSFAKVNLYLDITGILPDGYHTIESVMQSVELCDVLVINRSAVPGIRLACSHPDIPADDGNTAHKAAKAFCAAAGINIERFGAAVYIEKKIPARAGLGGGSANAAAVLIGLNELFDTRFSMEELAGIGAGIGADIPFCVMGGTMLAKGRGEDLTALPVPKSCGFVILKPPGGVDTANAYKMYDESGAPQRNDIKPMLDAIDSGDPRGIAGRLYNVFERVHKSGEVEAAQKALGYNGALGAVMTGSGNAVVGVYGASDIGPVTNFMDIEDGRAEVFAVKPVPCGTEIIYKD